MKITHRIVTTPGHTTMTLWADGANIGSITVGNDQKQILDLIVDGIEARGVQRAVDWLLSYAREQSDKGRLDNNDIGKQHDGVVRALAIRDAADQMKKALT
jgi:hypothetical protein